MEKNHTREVKINFKRELDNEVKTQINFIREEFDALFQHKIDYTEYDRKTANDLLKYFSKIIDTPVCLDYLSKTLEYLESQYPGLF